MLASTANSDFHHGLLAQLVGQRAPDLIALLVGVALDTAAARGDAALIAHGLTVEQAKACLAEHSQLPPSASLVETIDHGERLRELDAILTQVAASRLDVNVMMRNLNHMYDQIVAALKQPSHAARKQALDRIDIELNRRAADAKAPIRRVTRLVIDSRSTSSQSVSDSLVLMLMPMHLLADVAQSRVQVRRDLVRIGFALAAYRGEHGNYPKDLNELVPEILVTLPLDRFTDKPLIYSPRENGFLVYSVGPNGVDDGGRESNERNDDIGLQVPIPHDLKL